MAKVAFFSTQPYDRKFFENSTDRHEIEFFETRLNRKTVNLVQGFDAVCVFVNDNIDAEVLKSLKEQGVGLVALRCAGFNNIDLQGAKDHDVRVMRVPAYSPEAVAEHALALIMTLARKTHKAYNRVRDGNFSLVKLTGFMVHGKTIGLIGTGKIGQAFARIMVGMGAKVVAYDKYPVDNMKQLGVKYMDLDDVFKNSDILSLHCPLTPETHHIINVVTLQKMKKGSMLVNTSRGKLVDTASVIEALKTEQLGALAIDVYEEEEKLFFRDLSEKIIRDDQISRLMNFHNVLVTAHQGFFTQESMQQITETTVQNITDFENEKPETPNDVSCKLIKDCK